MWHGVDGSLSWSPSLVRIDKGKGYVHGNWRVISRAAMDLENAAAQLAAPRLLTDHPPRLGTG